MPFYLFAWVASISYAIEVIVGKLVIKYQVANPWLFNFFWSLFIVILIVPFGLVNGAGIPRFWGNLILASLFYALSGIGYLIALKKLDVSIISPLSNLRAIFSLLLGALFLREHYSFESYMLITVVIGASFFVTIDEQISLKTFFKRDNIWMIGVLLSLSLMSLFINYSVKENDFWEVTLWMPIIAQLLLLGTLPLWKSDIKKVQPASWGGIFLMGLFGTIGTMAANKAYTDNVGISTVIISLPISMMAAILLSFIAPKLLEKHTAKIYAIRIIAAAVMIIGTLSLTL